MTKYERFIKACSHLDDMMYLLEDMPEAVEVCALLDMVSDALDDVYDEVNDALDDVH